MSDEPEKLTTIECAVCETWIAVYRQYTRDKVIIVWNTRDVGACHHPPLQNCPQARTEIRRMFPDETIE